MPLKLLKSRGALVKMRQVDTGIKVIFWYLMLIELPIGMVYIKEEEMKMHSCSYELMLDSFPGPGFCVSSHTCPHKTEGYRFPCRDSFKTKCGARTRANAWGTEFTKALALLHDPKSDATLNTVALCLTCLSLLLALEGSPRAWMRWLEGTEWKSGSWGSWNSWRREKGMEGKMKETLGRKLAKGKSCRSGLRHRATAGKTGQL